MKYTKESLIKNIDDGKQFGYLFFWGHKPAKDLSITKSCFSQWWQGTFTVDDKIYKTSEHWMMEKKALLFGDKAIAEQIIATDDPAKVKSLGRLVSGYDDVIWKKNMSKL